MVKVILLEDIPGLGRKNEVKDVKPGYFLNYLKPKKLAKLLDESSKVWLEKVKKEKEEEKEKIEKLALKLEGKEFTFYLKKLNDQQPYGSVDSLSLEKEIKKEFPGDFPLETLPKKIKKFGKHEVEVIFPYGIKTKIKVNILPED